jgi:peptidoglycan hydrolase-like protein with peptidoglycan-binding domain
MNHNLPTIQQGDSGIAVSVLQRLLIIYGHDKFGGLVDGEFGTQTEEAVKEFQRFQNLASKDGVVGDKTWSQLANPAGL